MAAKKSRKKKTAKKPATNGSVNKSEFVRQHAHLKPAEIVELAAKRGIKMSPQYVSSIRSATRRKAGKTAPAGTRGRKPAGAAPVGGKLSPRVIAALAVLVDALAEEQPGLLAKAVGKILVSR